jgi:lysine-specific demethylase 8
MSRTPQAVERLERPSPETLRREYISANKPVVITGVAERWGAVSRWTPEYFKTSFADATVSIRTWDDEGPFDEPDAYLKNKVGVAKLGAFVDSMRSAASPKNYVLALPLFRQFPQLRRDVGPLDRYMGLPSFYPEALQRRLKEEPRFFLGPAGTVSALHFDGYHNFFVQVYGRKKFTLISPEQSRLVYYPWDYPRTHYSPVNVGRPDLDRFPLFREVETLEAVVGPGEILFIPVRWWHYVLALDESISLNFWWYSAATLLSLRHPLFVHGKGRLLGYLKRRLRRPR